MADLEFTTEELTAEEWRDIPGYEGFYQASDLGRIRSARKRGSTFVGRILIGRINKTGYPVVYIMKGSKRSAKSVFIHRLVASAFLGPLPDGMEVNHSDNNRANPRPANLEYVTHKENMAHAARQGRMSAPRGPSPWQQGEKSAQAKLKACDVIEIRQAILDGVPATELAKQYSVTTMTISKIKLGQSWQHLEVLRDEVRALGSHKTRHRIPRGLNRYR